MILHEKELKTKKGVAKLKKVMPNGRRQQKRELWHRIYYDGHIRKNERRRTFKKAV